MKNLFGNRKVKKQKIKKVAFYIGRNGITMINSEGLTLKEISQLNEEYLQCKIHLDNIKKNDLYLVEYAVNKDILGSFWEFTLIDSKKWGDLKTDIAAHA